MKFVATEILVTRNDRGTIFVEIDGDLVADAITFQRRRGFWNKRTERWASARGFTPRKVAAAPELVRHYLAETGLDVIGPIVVRF